MGRYWTSSTIASEHAKTVQQLEEERIEVLTLLETLEREVLNLLGSSAAPQRIREIACRWHLQAVDQAGIIARSREVGVQEEEGRWYAQRTREASDACRPRSHLLDRC